MKRGVGAVRSQNRARSYRLARRSFLAGVGGAVGLYTLLKNLEASAQGVTPPPRLFDMFWPVGTVRYLFVPEGTGTSYTPSRILMPFEEAGLRDDMTILYGLSMTQMNAGCGGGSEGGVVLGCTGADSPGTRENGGEQDDTVAGGPSFDQVFLRHVEAMQGSPLGSAHAICDAVVDSNETSSRCLSYDYTKRSIPAARISAGGCQNVDASNIEENVPILPTLSPADLYTSLFSGFMPGPDGSTEEARLALMRRKSVLDYSLDELERLKTLAPHAEAPRIDAHAEAVRRVETQLSDAIENGTLTEECVPPEAPDPGIVGDEGSRFDYGNPQGVESQRELHAQVGALHASIIQAAFQCDLIRAATFMWSPSTNHVAFDSLYPGDPDGVYMHHPMSHRISNRNDVMTSLPSGTLGEVVEFLANVQTWYNSETAAILNSFKQATDVFGGNLLEHTVVSFFTDTAETTHSRSPMPALLFGGSALGLRGGQFFNFEDSLRSHNDLWMTVAQALLGTEDPLAALEGEAFNRDGVAPIDGIWVP